MDHFKMEEHILKVEAQEDSQTTVVSQWQYKSKAANSNLLMEVAFCREAPEKTLKFLKYQALAVLIPRLLARTT